MLLLPPLITIPPITILSPHPSNSSPNSLSPCHCYYYQPTTLVPHPNITIATNDVTATGGSILLLKIDVILIFMREMEP